MLAKHSHTSNLKEFLKKKKDNTDRENNLQTLCLTVSLEYMNKSKLNEKTTQCKTER